MNRKINTKLVRSNDAVSAVIGVILMVAITVAIAATVFIYVNNMTQIDEQAPQILGTTHNIADGVSIELSGKSIDNTSVRITVTDINDGVASISPPSKATKYNLSDDTLKTEHTGNINLSYFTWIDANGDDKIGSGDTLKLTNDGGLATGTWYVKIIHISSGKPSMSLALDIN